MDLLITLLAFAFALGVIIVVHEAGHLWVAKACKVRVLAFSVGFGKRLFGIERGGTDYRLSALPLGGYVKLAGEGAEDEKTDDPHDFQNRPRWQRILVYLAGPAMNIVFSYLLFAALFIVGIDVQRRPERPARVGAVEAGSPAAAAGIVPGERVTAIGGTRIDTWGDALPLFAAAPGRALAVTVERGGEEAEGVPPTPRITRTVTLAPRATPAGGVSGIIPDVLPRIAHLAPGGRAEKAGLRVGDFVRTLDGAPVVDFPSFIDYIGKHAEKPITFGLVRNGAPLAVPVVPQDQGGSGKVGLGLGFYERHPAGRSLVESLGYNGWIVRNTIGAIGRIVTGKTAAKNALSGPVGIASSAGAAAKSGFKDLLHLMGLLSVSIALLNLFPIPLLDGGQILILLVESAIRRDLPVKVKEVVGYAGFAAVVVLMLFTVWVDVARIFHL